MSIVQLYRIGLGISSMKLSHETGRLLKYDIAAHEASSLINVRYLKGGKFSTGRIFKTKGTMFS